MAAACLINLPGEAWPLLRKAHVEAVTEKEELVEQERLEVRALVNKKATVMERWNERSITYFNEKLLSINWQEITEQKFVEVTSETERFITGYMAVVDQLEYALHRANKLKMWIFREIELLEDSNKTIEIWMDQMKRLRKWQSDNFGQV